MQHEEHTNTKTHTHKYTHLIIDKHKYKKHWHKTTSNKFIREKIHTYISPHETNIYSFKQTLTTTLTRKHNYTHTHKQRQKNTNI